MTAPAAGADFTPMLAGTVAMRYTCRHAQCASITITEMGWFIAKAEKKEMWFCGACGNEYKRKIVAEGAVDSRGKD